MSIRRGGNIVAGSVNKKEIVDLIENETRVNIKTITGTLTTASSTISLNADDLTDGSQILSVNLGNTVILPNLYSLSNDGKTLTFVETIDANTNYAISYVKKFDIGGGEDIDLSEYATKTDLDSKQNKLTAGENISINNDVISSTTTIDPNIANWSNNVTNCITEIPQDIKLETTTWYAFEPVATASYYYSKTPTLEVGSVLHYYIDESSYDPNGEVKVISIETTSNGTFYTIEATKDYYNFNVGYTHSNVRRYAEEDITTLVLKAGSKVYVPNGTGNFDEVTVDSDINYQGSDTVSVSRLVYYNKTTNRLLIIGSHSSGTTDTPNNTVGNCVHYNTSTNKIQLYTDGVAQSGEISLPLCIVKSDGVNIVSTIEQVFNGFGYIGSTVFALPGIKGLIPNGRNADGSLKNIEFTNPVVRTLNVSGTYNQKLCIATTGIGSYTYVYDEIKNAIYNTYSSAYYNADRLIVGDISYTNGAITSLQPKTTFHTLDYNDKPEITGWSAPGSKKIDLTFGASGATYTAPANGWLCVYGIASVANGYVEVAGKLVTGGQNAAATGSIWVSAQAKKGDIITIRYANYTNQRFYFRCAEGEI